MAGWQCHAKHITVRLDEGEPIPAGVRGFFTRPRGACPSDITADPVLKWVRALDLLLDPEVRKKLRQMRTIREKIKRRLAEHAAAEAHQNPAAAAPSPPPHPPQD